MPRPLSDSWQYFELLEKIQGKSRKARCKFCGHEQSAGITRLHQHLLERCSRISADIRDQLKQRQDRDSITPDSIDLANRNASPLIHSHQNQDSTNYDFDSSLQNTLGSNTNTQQSSPLNNINTQTSFYEAALSPTDSTNFATATPLTFQPTQPCAATPAQPQQQQGRSSQAMLDYHLARALFSANIPLQKIENPFFIDFLKLLQPNYMVPTAKTLQHVLLKEQHWDLICDTQPSRSIPALPPPLHNNNTAAAPMFQQQRRIMRFSSTGNNNGNTNNSSHMMMNSLHSSTDLEGSL